jgi:hypothetical protein
MKLQMKKARQTKKNNHYHSIGNSGSLYDKSPVE